MARRNSAPLLASAADICATNQRSRVQFLLRRSMNATGRRLSFAFKAPKKADDLHDPSCIIHLDHIEPVHHPLVTRSIAQ
jgi:hypothetical protein